MPKQFLNGAHAIGPSDDAYWRAMAITEFVEPWSPTTLCSHLFEEVIDKGRHIAVPVVDDHGRVAGLIEHHKLVMQCARRLIRDLYQKRPITSMMETNPPIVDIWTPIEALSDHIVHARTGDRLGDLIVTCDGQYVGMAPAMSLLKRLRELSDRRLDEANRAKAEAVNANHAKSELLANMSHELRTPLNAIIGFSEVMRDEILGSLGHARYRDYAADIHYSGGLLLDLINDILDLSKAEAGRLDLTDDLVDLEDCARMSLRLMRERAARARVSLHHRALSAVPPLRADRRRLQQICLNLLSNAIKFTPPGGSVVLCTTIGPGGGARLIVEDTGVGIAPQDISKVLEPFGQVATVTPRRREGTGLGLPIVLKLARAHGGDLRLHSSPGLGTTVMVDLPPQRLIA